MEVHALTSDGFFRLYTACPGDAKTFVLDVRARKAFAAGHALGAYCVRLAASDPRALLDYSKAHYEVPWSQHCWWGKRVVVYGDAGLAKAHPVVAMLAQEKRAASLAIYREGLEGLQKHYPFLVTTSVRGSPPRYPSEILPQVLYLGDWDAASQTERLQELKISRVITVHNNPENLRLPGAWDHLRITLADVETQDISPHFAPAFDFIEAGKLQQRATLVHCGAGVSRSAALCVAYLMRRLSWTADQALAHCKARRSLVEPNAGFWRSLCALEEPLGLAKRSNPGTASFPGADAPVQLASDAAGERVSVDFVPLRRLAQASRAQAEGPATAAAATAAAEREPAGGKEPAAAAAAAGESSPAGGGAASAAEGAEGGGRERDRRGAKEGERREGRGRDASREGREHRKRRQRRSGSREGGGRDRREGRRREGRSRSRSRGRDRPRRRPSRSRSRERPRRVKEEERGDGERGAEAQAPGRDEANGEKEPEKDAGDSKAAEEAPSSGLQGKEVVLRVAKAGKTVGLLELGMRGAHACAVVGRDPACALHLEHLSISRRHAHLTTDLLGALYITDLNSAHRTWADGVWLRPETPRRLLKGAKFKFGASSREYEVLKTPKDPPLPPDFVPA